MVTVRLFARLRELTGKEVVSIFVDQPVSLKQFMENLSTSLPQIISLVHNNHLIVAINQEVAAEETMIQDGDEIVLMPPFFRWKLSTLNL